MSQTNLNLKSTIDTPLRFTQQQSLHTPVSRFFGTPVSGNSTARIQQPFFRDSSVESEGTRQPSLSYDRQCTFAEALEIFAATLGTTENDHEAAIIAEKYTKLTEEVLSDLEIQRYNGIFDNNETRGCYALFEAERNTWKLIFQLQSHRNFFEASVKEKDDIIETTDNFAKEGQLLEQQEITDKQFGELSLVLDWLQGVAPPFVAVETTSYYWPYTLKDLERGKIKTFDDIVDELDPDAPHRQFKRLHQNDESHEKELIRSIFEYLRRGNLNMSIDLCLQNGHHWRAASLAGWCPHKDTTDENNILDRYENPHRGNIARRLWRATCYQLAKEPSLNIYERGAYAVLCGDSTNIIPLCDKWEDFLWAYYVELVERERQKYLSWFPSRGPDIEEGLEMKFEADDLDVSQIFERVEEHLQIKNRDHIDNPLHLIFHQVQKFCILDQYSLIIPYLNSQIEKISLSEVFDAHIIRFSAHLVLYLREVLHPTPLEEADYVLEKYVDLLIKFKKYDLILTYLVNLPRERTIHLYANFLKTLDLSKEQRERYVDIAKDFQLEVSELLIRIVEIVFQEAKIEEPEAIPLSSVKLINTSNPIEVLDQFQISTLEWLTFLPKENLLKALKEFNDLSRRLLASGKLNGMKKILEIVKDFDALSDLLYEEKFVAEAKEPIKDEFISYESMFNFFAAYEEWDEAWNQKPLRSEISLLENWTLDIENKSSKVEKAFRHILMAKISQGDLEGDQQKDVYLRLRIIYMPEIIFRFHKMLYESRDVIQGNLEKSLRLADIVADDQYQFYQEFKHTKKLGPFLLLIRESSRLILEKTGDVVI
ncbi:hypothetical protein G9A89_015707 [Geosiphon pyriformis]|nr:hypothetical protein G9A89_015707 [Geosiphon pyriformis]